jgi:hypothetical protein
MSMMFPGVVGMTNTNQQQGQNFNVAMQAARFMRRSGRRGSSSGLTAQQQADLMTHGSQLKLNEMTHGSNLSREENTHKSQINLNEMTHGSNLAREEVTHKADTANEEYIRAHGQAEDPQTGLVPGGHVGAFRKASITVDRNGVPNGNTSFAFKPTAGGGLSGGGFSAGTMNVNQGAAPQGGGPAGGRGPQQPAHNPDDDIIDAEIIEEDAPGNLPALTRGPLALPAGQPQSAARPRPAGPLALPVGSTPPGPLNEKGYLQGKTRGKARKVLGTVTKSILPLAESAGEALL